MFKMNRKIRQTVNDSSCEVLMRIDEKMQIVKQRALALASHVDMLDEAEP